MIFSVKGEDVGSWKDVLLSSSLGIYSKMPEPVKHIFSSSEIIFLGLCKVHLNTGQKACHGLLAMLCQLHGHEKYQ